MVKAEPVDFALALDRAGGRRYPLGQQLADELRRRVQAGALGPGERLPPVRGLATALQVTPETVAGAYKRLVEEGYLRGEVGRGTFVAAPPLGAEENPLAPFEAGGALPPFAAPQRELLRLANQPGLVSFAASVAALELAPVDRLRDAIAHVLDDEGPGALQVGATQGYPPLRAAIAELLKQRGLHVDANGVCVTSGCQQGIDLTAKVFVGAGDVVLVEQPSFLGALEAFRARGARVIGVPIEEDGLRVEALPGLIQRYRPKLLYCMPTYQNPTGRSLSAVKRSALLRIAAAFDLPIVEDDSAGFFHLQGEAPPSLKAEDHAGYVIHLGTFSKLIAAGLRLGWLVADPPVFDKLVAAKYASDLSSDALVQRAMERLLADGTLQAHLRHARVVYRDRRDVLVDALQAPGTLPAQSRFDTPAGGFNLWLELPRDGPTSTELYLEAVRRGVAFVPGPFFFSAGGGGAASPAALRGLRLSYSALDASDLRRGVDLLRDALEALPASNRAEALVY
ncbi:MAG: PLP-dependent aminotransferase family protein [Chloroflexi bacterium]|nr:PLP-dependent aminotransferase family protein [Chloroflexota bacterium]